ncbi:MAG: alpha/beta hydrolase [Xanthobacteraceae bacterium]|nr:alpha/beta hydrolase [Xanthobacteraceae bacterium]
MTAQSSIFDRKALAPEQVESVFAFRSWRVMIWIVVTALILACGYVVWGYTGIRHEKFSFYDVTRQRKIDVDIAIRRDLAMHKDNAEKLPVAIINHGNTVSYTEYSFISNLLATKGFMAVSIQHDLATDAPLATKIGEPFVGREAVYERGVQNIEYVLQRIPLIRPNADLRHLVMVGHSNGGDIAMYFARLHPELVRDVVTLDNLRVPLEGPFKILSVRSKDPNFVADKGVVPSDDICEKSGITIVHTDYRHTDMSDRGPETVRETIGAAVTRFLTSKNGQNTFSPRS